MGHVFHVRLTVSKPVVFAHIGHVFHVRLTLSNPVNVRTHRAHFSRVLHAVYVEYTSETNRMLTGGGPANEPSKSRGLVVLRFEHLGIVVHINVAKLLSLVISKEAV